MRIAGPSTNLNQKLKQFRVFDGTWDMMEMNIS